MKRLEDGAITKEIVIGMIKIDKDKPTIAVEGDTMTIAQSNRVSISVSNGTANLGETEIAYKIDDGEWQSYTDEITVSDDTGADGVTYTFKATSASGVESEEVSITVKRDIVAPDGDIKIEENSVKAFINAVTFGLFYNENVDVSITSEDAGSGVQSTWYYRSDTTLTEEQIAALTDGDWTAYTGTISVTAEDAEKFIYYVKVTDNAGNTTCFASNGATFDLADPVISGVTNGANLITPRKRLRIRTPTLRASH